MPASTGPDLKKYMDKKLQSAHLLPAPNLPSCHAHLPYPPLPPPSRPLAVKLNANRHITGTLRGFDQFMNLVIDEAVEQAAAPRPSPLALHCAPACTLARL